MIAFVGSVFSPYYHWAGRRDPENHVAFNLALYQPSGDLWTMTERGSTRLSRDADRLSIGDSSVFVDNGNLNIEFSEMALPWPGQRLWPKRVSGRMTITPSFVTGTEYRLDPARRHHWWPVVPSGRVTVECDAFPDGGWQGHAYHDINRGSRPIEADFKGWDWARGEAEDEATVLLYDSVLRDGARQTLAIEFLPDGSSREIAVPARKSLPRGFWGVRGGISCDDASQPRLKRKLEDTPFYTRSLVDTDIGGRTVSMVHETLDCIRLANPVVRLMLPFRMPRNKSG